MVNTLVPIFLLALHPFYVSITTIDYNEKAQRVEISCRIFYDDLETALQSGDGLSVDLINPPNQQAVDTLLAHYFRHYFRLSVNDKATTLRYLGYEIEEDVAWCFLEVGGIAAIKSITIDSRILYDQFPKQSNILHVTAYGKRKSMKLDNPKRRVVFEW